MPSTSLPERPQIGIVGGAGAYGRWLRSFFRDRMELDVAGHDPADPGSLGPDALLARSDVLVFAAPIRATPGVIEAWALRARGRDRAQLWLDITSVKAAPIEAMLRSQAEVVGLHPLTAPPKTPTLRGRVIVVCEARLARWRPWLEGFLRALEAECVRVTPEQHDRSMALVQALAHAVHLGEARVIGERGSATGGLEQLLKLRTPLFEMDAAIVARMLSLSPAIYEDIQFANPDAPKVLEALAASLRRMAELVADGSDDARAAFRREFLSDARQAFSASELEEGNYTFERVAYLLADLNDAQVMSVYLPQDRPGSLRRLLAVFERHGVNIASLHSSRTAAGELHFRFGFDAGTPDAALRAVATALQADGVGRVLQD